MNKVIDGGPWKGPANDEWVDKIKLLSTPKREREIGGPWIKPTEHQCVCGGPPHIGDCHFGWHNPETCPENR